MKDVHTAEDKRNPKARNPREAFSTGLYCGALLTLVMLASLVVADRIPGIERYALERNGISYALFLVVMVYPVCRFRNRPLQIFIAGMTGWVMFAAAYNLSGFYFRNLFQVLRTPLEALVEGTIVYGVCAVIAWVGMMAMHARHHTIAPGRRRPDDAVPHHH
jgi:nitrate/nitrite transporter NarK